MNTNTKEPSEQLIEMLGQPYNPKSVQALLQPFGVKRMPTPNSYFNDDIIWSVKSSIRIDIYRVPKINDLTGLSYSNEDGWIIGAIHFLAPGADDRIKSPFSGTLPNGIKMSSTPEQAIMAYGSPALDDECEWSGFTGRILAWRKSGINIAIEFEDGDNDQVIDEMIEVGNDFAIDRVADPEITRVMRSYTACLIGCIGAWRNDNPEVFAP